ncbi:MAG: hypothetical protein RIQ78_1655, partial [Bacteroidota bacterium]
MNEQNFFIKGLRKTRLFRLASSLIPLG